MNHKPCPKKIYRWITREKARKHHNKRSSRAKMLDSKQNNSVIVRDERFLLDSAHTDFPNVDIKNRCAFGGAGRAKGRAQRYKKNGKKIKK